MTGFAHVKRDTEGGSLSISLRGVNHRGLDLHFYQPFEFAAFENAMRGMLKERIGRGHLEIRSSIARDVGQRSGLNAAALKSYAEAFRTAAQELGLEERPNLNALLALPGVVTTQVPEASVSGTETEAELLTVLGEAISMFNESREREGEKLGEEMRAELRQVETATAEIQELRNGILPAFQQWLEDKMRVLLGESGIAESRIVEECALLADRSDIQEEVTRLTVHASELRRILSAGGAVGKQIDFLLQELNRETNTTLAKSSNAGEPGLKITTLALSVKANIERIREQALNLE